jgi:hypothetical protein
VQQHFWDFRVVYKRFLLIGFDGKLAGSIGTCYLQQPVQGRIKSGSVALTGSCDRVVLLPADSLAWYSEKCLFTDAGANGTYHMVQQRVCLGHVA